MKTLTCRTALVTALGLALLLAVALPSAVAKDKQQPIESYSGHYINPNPGSIRAANFVNIEIFSWTTDDERQAWAQTLAASGSDALVSSMRDDKVRVGSVRLPGTISYDLKYAREIQTDKGRQIVLATDRPVAMGEVAFNARTLDYGLTIIEFLMPTSGEAGSGSILAGAELTLEADGKLTIENMSFQPLRFQDVKLKTKKKKK